MKIVCLHCKEAKLEKVETYLYTHAIDNVWEYYTIYRCPNCSTLFEEAHKRPGRLLQFPKFVK